MIIGCAALAKPNISNCLQRQSAIEIAFALPSSASVRNEFFYGQRRLAAQFGTNASKSQSHTKIDPSQNALTSDMAVALIRVVGDAPRLHGLDVRRNSIDESAGHAFATFITKSSTIRMLDLSHDPILNVVSNKELGQRKFDEETQKPGGNPKDRKSKNHTPACY
jgi:hypothetical protein